MSNLELLSVEETIKAINDGWQPVHVYDLKAKRWTVEILPVVFATPFASASQAGAHVVGLARGGDPIAVKALSLVMASYNPGKKNEATTRRRRAT